MRDEIYAARLAIWRKAAEESAIRCSEKIRRNGERLDAFRAALASKTAATLADHREASNVWSQLAASVLSGVNFSASMSLAPRPAWRRLLDRLTTPGVPMIAFLKRWYLLRLSLKLIALGIGDRTAEGAVRDAAAMLAAVRVSATTLPASRPNESQ